MLPSSLGAAISSLADVDDWDLVSPASQAGAPVSEVPGRLAALIRGGMDSVKRVLAEGARAQVSTAAVCAATLRNVFFECFTEFSLAMDKVRTAGRSAISCQCKCNSLVRRGGSARPIEAAGLSSW